MFFFFLTNHLFLGIPHLWKSPNSLPSTRETAGFHSWDGHGPQKQRLVQGEPMGLCVHVWTRKIVGWTLTVFWIPGMLILPTYYVEAKKQAARSTQESHRIVLWGAEYLAIPMSCGFQYCPLKDKDCREHLQRFVTRISNVLSILRCFPVISILDLPEHYLYL